MEERSLFYQCDYIFMIAGFWRTKNQSNWTLPFLWVRRFIIYVMFGVFFVIFMYSGIPIHYKEGDYLRAMEAGTFPTAVITMQLKLSVLIYHENDIKNYSQILRKLIRRHKNTDRVDASLQMFQRILSVGLSTMSACILAYVLYPIFLKGPRFLTTSTAFTFGLDVLQSPYYELYMAYESIAYLTNAFLAMSFDMMYCGILSVTGAIFKNINDEIKSTLICQPGGVEFEKRSSDKTKMEETLRKTIIDFIETTEFIKETGTTYMAVNLFHFGYNLIIIAFTLYQASLITVGSIRWFSMILAILAVGLQLVAYCHFGQEIATQCNEYWTNLYFMDWCNQSTKFKQMILFSLQGTQNEIYLSAGKMLNLSRDTLKNILRAVFTYYTFLMKVRRDSV